MNKVSKPLDNTLHHKPFSTIFITRFVYGIYHATLIRAGALRLPLRPYFKTIIVSSFFWVSLVGGIAYFSSAYIGLFKKYLKYGEVALLIGIVIFLVISHFLSKYTRKEIESNGDDK